MEHIRVEVFYNSNSGHDYGWPYGVVTRDKYLDWSKLKPWLIDNVGIIHKDWSVGRFEIVFKTLEHCTLFQLTWC